MARLQQQFNANAIDPTQGGGFSQLPVGDHPVIITASEIKATGDNTGGMVVFELKVIGGPKEGSSGTWRLNLYNKSDQARGIAEAQMSALCHATGIFLIDDTAQLHNQPFAVRVTEQALTEQQLEKQRNGEKVTPFTQVSRVLMADGTEVKGGHQGQPQGQQGGGNWGAQNGGQQGQQQPQQGNQGAQGGWGGGQQNTQQQQPQGQQTNGGWGGQQNTQQQPQNQGNGGGWSQGQGGGNPAWGQKK